MYEAYALTGKLNIEFKTIKAMVSLYCHAKHKSNQTPCNECKAFINYANEKLDRCPYGENKPTCNKCPIHCYKADQRIQAKEIMRFAGPRMLLMHPILAISHLFAENRPIPTKIPHKASNRHKRNSKV